MKNPGEFIDWIKHQPKGENTLNYYLREVCDFLNHQNNLLLEAVTDVSHVIVQTRDGEAALNYIKNRCDSVLKEVMNER